MQIIDVSDLPEPYVRAVKAVVESFRRQLAIPSEKRKPPTTPRAELPRWRLGVIGDLTREEIYDDRV